MQSRNSPASGFMSQQKLLQTTNSLLTPQIRYRFLRSRSALTWTALSVPWRARFAASLPQDSMHSRCGYSVVDAIHLIGTGEGPLVSLGVPGSVFPIQSRGDSVRRDRRIGSQPQGDGAAGLYKSVPEQIVSVMSARLPPPPFSRASFRPSVHAAPAPPAFYVPFWPARAARTGVRTPPGTALSVPTGNCSRPGQC